MLSYFITNKVELIARFWKKIWCRTSQSNCHLTVPKHIDSSLIKVCRPNCYRPRDRGVGTIRVPPFYWIQVVWPTNICLTSIQHKLSSVCKNEKVTYQENELASFQCQIWIVKTVSTNPSFKKCSPHTHIFLSHLLSLITILPVLKSQPSFPSERISVIYEYFLLVNL